MTLILFFLILLTLAFFCRRRSRAVHATTKAVILALALSIGCGVLPQALLNNLQIYPSLRKPLWAENNVIVVLGAGTTTQTVNETRTIKTNPTGFARVYEAARLYFNCLETNKNCTILVSGGDPRQAGRSEAEVMADELIALQVEPEHVWLEKESLSTFANAKLTAAILRQQPAAQVTLVTSGYHLRRAKDYFAHFGVLATPAPADHWQAFISFLPIVHNFTVMELVLHEYIGLARFHIYNWLGLN